MVPANGASANCSGSSDRCPFPGAARRAFAAIACAAALGAAFGAACAASGTAGAAPGGAGAAGNPAGTTITGEPEGTRESLETEATTLLNEARAQPRNCGLVSFDAAPPLHWNSALAAAAAAHSLWMQTTDTTRHEENDGSSVGDRAQAAGYDWKGIAENLAAGQPALREVLAGWLASPPHCENIMNPAFEDFALAMVPGTSRNRFPTWWTLVLGEPRN